MFFGNSGKWQQPILVQAVPILSRFLGAVDRIWLEYLFAGSTYFFKRWWDILVIVVGSLLHSVQLNQNMTTTPLASSAAVSFSWIGACGLVTCAFWSSTEFVLAVFGADLKLETAAISCVLFIFYCCFGLPPWMLSWGDFWCCFGVFFGAKLGHFSHVSSWICDALFAFCFA